ncbi:MAG TPA: CoA pyrophosphatase [Micropepsaceae bacterium]|jgi:8-oxo-dGTP pyrophosphatase MutT (NUDIX family)|nr:CoA pyrophosphatase [Micropepsaceae bacterium]
MKTGRIKEGGGEAGPGSLSRERIRASLRRTPPELSASESGLRPAAVLLPIVERAEPYALFTRRTDDLPSHAGQICFPGGRYHPDDDTLIRTALREMEEEIGLPHQDVEVAGFLDSYETLNTGFAILPVVGFLRDDFTLVVNPREVAEVFEAPLSYILDPKNHAIKSVERGGVMREFYAIDYAGHTIWGATAAMIVNLSERLGLR